MASCCGGVLPAAHQPKLSGLHAHTDWTKVFYFTEYKKKLEDDCSLLRAANAAKEEECKSLKLKIEIFDEILEKQRMAAEE